MELFNNKFYQLQNNNNNVVAEVLLVIVNNTRDIYCIWKRCGIEKLRYVEAEEMRRRRNKKTKCFHCVECGFPFSYTT